MIRNSKKSKAFTLVELLVVVIIISILATIAITSYNGAQRVARDNKRKADLQTIGSAYLIEYQDTKSWIATTVAGGVQEGINGNGFFNLTGVYTAGMSSTLAARGYLTTSPSDPLITDNSKKTQTVGSFAAVQYQKHLCYASGTTANPSGIVLFARLEDSKSIATPYILDPDDSLIDSCFDNTGSIRLKDLPDVKGNLMNYAVMFR